MSYTNTILLTLLLTLPLALNTAVYAQKSTTHIYGTVLDNNDNPIPGVNVFVSGTTIGASTNSNGEFRFFFKNMPDDRYSLIFSNIVYKNFKYKFETPVEKNALSLKVYMEEDIKKLNEITVTAERDKKWEKNYELFKEAFLGQTDNGKMLK